MKEMRWERWGAASGFAALAVGAAATAFERGVPTGDSVRELTDFYARNRDALLAQSLLFLISAGIFLWYVGSLRTFLARAEGRTGGLSMVAFGAGVDWTAVSVAAQAFQIGLAMGSKSEVQPALAGTMMALFIGANLLVAVMLSVGRGGVLPNTGLSGLAGVALGCDRRRQPGSFARDRREERPPGACRPDYRVRAVPGVRGLVGVRDDHDAQRDREADTGG